MSNEDILNDYPELEPEEAIKTCLAITTDFPNSSHTTLEENDHAMVGVSQHHNLISLSIASEKRQQLKDKPCRTYMSDMKLRIKTETFDVFYHPDVMVSNGATLLILLAFFVRNIGILIISASLSKRRSEILLAQYGFQGLNFST